MHIDVKMALPTKPTHHNSSPIIMEQLLENHLDIDIPFILTLGTHVYIYIHHFYTHKYKTEDGVIRFHFISCCFWGLEDRGEPIKTTAST